MKILILILLLPVSSALIIPRTLPKHESIYANVKSYVSKYVQDKQLCRRYITVITNCAKTYGIKPMVIAKRIKKESCFYPEAKGDWTGEVYESFGPMQIKPKYFSHLLYFVDNGKLGAYIRKRRISNYLEHYDGSYEKAISAYGFGMSHPSHKKVVKDPDIVYDTNLKYYGFVRECLE
jgi:hypothetical protein